MMETTFCWICNIEIYITLLHEQINSKEHKEIEDYLIVRGMTYGELCSKETRNDEWRTHIISEKHLQFEKKFIVIFARTNIQFGVTTVHFQKRSRDVERNHINYTPISAASDEITHSINQQRLKICSS